jgi:hypothetical protein
MVKLLFQSFQQAGCSRQIFALEPLRKLPDLGHPLLVGLISRRLSSAI